MALLGGGFGIASWLLWCCKIVAMIFLSVTVALLCGYYGAAMVLLRDYYGVARSFALVLLGGWYGVSRWLLWCC